MMSRLMPHEEGKRKEDGKELRGKKTKTTSRNARLQGFFGKEISLSRSVKREREFKNKLLRSEQKPEQ
jgi:hypothetical protein